MIDWGTDEQLRRFKRGAMYGMLLAVGITLCVMVLDYTWGHPKGMLVILWASLAIAIVQWWMYAIAACEVHHRAIDGVFDRIETGIHAWDSTPTYRQDGDHIIQDGRKCSHFVHGLDDLAGDCADHCNLVAGPFHCHGTDDKRCPLPKVNEHD